MFNTLRAWARRLKQDAHALYLAARDSRTPWQARLLALVVAAYALSPIDLIPDVIPVIGYLDDIILVPLGIWAVMKLIPPALMAEYRAAAVLAGARPVSRSAAVAIVLLWLGAAALVLWWGVRQVRG